ncbi:restriction endonuclease subunit S [Streptomyces hirsutus]|uniref:restriction endonuclease subunit S n=1 Tax=Streptomyces hirsutus TaxID=35620 RepID=UPI00386AB11F|nr:restriction endonuclease subunit S [Streptomyces hirsutus]
MDAEKELPAGWAWATLQDVAQWGSGGTPNTKEPAYYGGGIPWTVIGDLNDSVLYRTGQTITEDGLANSSARWAPAGSVLVAMYGASIGKLAVTAKPVTTNQAIAHAIPYREVMSRKYLFWYLYGQRAALIGAGKGGAQPNISQAVLKSWPIVVPPLAEQHRIVEVLEEQLSRIDSGTATLRQAHKRLEGLRKRTLVSSVPDEVPESWRMTTVEGAGALELGRARHPDWHHGPEMRPYLRVANVFEDRIDTTDVMEMDFSGIWEKYRLEPGDVLLNEGQSPHLVGRPALYRGIPKGVAFTNSLLRFKAGGDVLPEWALLVFRRHLHAKRFMREVRITTNIAHLSAKRLKKVEFPVPPLDVQKQIVQRCEELLSGIAAMDQQVGTGLRRADALRSALLWRAFTGGLVPQDSGEESAALLLARIAAEQAATPKPKRTRKATAKAPAQRAAESATAAPEPTPAPALAVQQEFEL